MKQLPTYLRTKFHDQILRRIPKSWKVDECHRANTLLGLIHGDIVIVPPNIYTRAEVCVRTLLLKENIPTLL